MIVLEQAGPGDDAPRDLSFSPRIFREVLLKGCNSLMERHKSVQTVTLAEREFLMQKNQS